MQHKNSRLDLYSYFNTNKVIFHLIFWGFHWGLFVFGLIQQKEDHERRVLNAIGTSVLISRASALVLSMDCSLLLIGVCRLTLTFLQPSLNKILPFQENIYFHKWTAYAMILFTFLHTESHYQNFFTIEYQLTKADLGDAWEIHYTQYGGVTGHIMVFVCLLMYTSSKLAVRQKNYELFWYTHHLFVPFYICMFFHSSGCFVKSADTRACKGYRSNFGTVPIFVFYLAERIYRFYRGYLPTRLTQVILHPGNTIELRIEKDSFKYEPGQYLYQ